MKQKPIIRKIMLMAAMLLATGSVTAQDFAVDAITYSVISTVDKTCAVKSADNSAIDVNLVIPKRVKFPAGYTDDAGDYYDVIEIQENAFRACNRLRTVSIPASVEYIGRWAFLKCDSLETVTFQPTSTPVQLYYDELRCSRIFPDQGTLVVGRPLKGYGLWKVDFGYYTHVSTSEETYHSPTYPTGLEILDGVDISMPQGGKFSCFASTVQGLIVGKNLTGEINYENYRYLNELVVTDSQPAEEVSFTDRQSLLTKLYVPQGSLSAYRSAAGWGKMYSISEYDGAPSLHGKTDRYDLKVDGIYLTILDKDGFEAMVAYKEIRSGKPYSDCSGDVVIPAVVHCNGLDIQISSIEREAFAGCDGLRGVVIPGTVTSIGYRAFYGCPRLESVDFESGPDLDFDNINSGHMSVYETFLGSDNIKSVIMGRPFRDTHSYYWSTLNAINLASKNWTVMDKSIVMNMKKIFENPANGRFADNMTIGEGLLGLNAEGNPPDFRYIFMDTLTMKDELPPVCPVFYDSVYEKTILTVPAGTLDDYRGAEGWNRFKYITEEEGSGIDGIISVVEKTMTGCYDLSGRQVDESYRGVTIIRYSDGSVGKVLR